MEKLKKHELKRNIIQLASTAFFNGYAKGFSEGIIFKGSTKQFCVPILNCYSCPGALGACPIGSLQSVCSSRKHHFSFYVVGTMMLFGILVGRLICGFLCPFGWLQDFLYKIPFPKLKISKKIDRPLRYLKYLILIIFVILLPAIVRNEYNLGTTFFCKYICPVGTLEAGFPLLLKISQLKDSLGFLFNWKLFILILVLLSSIFVYRPFCKYICPLGAFYSLFNKFSFYKLELNEKQCIGCHKCESVCKMDVECTKNINSMECIRCGKCAAICPTNAIKSKIELAKSTYKKSNE